jgi:hypothetical protein
MLHNVVHSRSKWLSSCTSQGCRLNALYLRFLFLKTGLSWREYKYYTAGLTKVPRFRSSPQSASTSFRPWKNKTGLLHNTPRNNLQTLLHDKGENMPCAKAKIWCWIIKCFSSQSSPFHGLHNTASSGSMRSSSETRVIAGLVSCAFVTAILRHTLVSIKNDKKLHYTHTHAHTLYIYSYTYIYI